MFKRCHHPAGRLSLALALACGAGTAQAELVKPSGEPNAYLEPAGGCPKGDRRFTLTARQKQPETRWCLPAKKNSGGKPSSGGVAYVEPVKAQVPKAQALTPCPTGYRSDEQRCVTAWDQAPRSQPKKGNCPNGTLAEWNAWCTAVVTDLSDRSLDMMAGYVIKDFNRLYLAHQLAGKTPPARPEDGAVLAQAKAERAATGRPWKPMHERDRDAEAAHTGSAESPMTADEGVGGDAAVPEAAKEALSKALKGLFGQ